jgi:hypothetical protein
MKQDIVKIINKNTPSPQKFVDLKSLCGFYTVFTQAELDSSDDELDFKIFLLFLYI